MSETTTSSTNSPQANEENTKTEYVIGNEVLTKSFEAMWYQAEVLHKRTQDKLENVEKVLKTHVEQVEKLEGIIKDRVMMFSQDIIATMKEMRAVEQDRINLLFALLQPKVSEDITNDPVSDHEVLEVQEPHSHDAQVQEHHNLESVEEELLVPHSSVPL